MGIVLWFGLRAVRNHNQTATGWEGADEEMRIRKVAAFLIVICILAGCASTDSSLRGSCTEISGKFPEQSQENPPTSRLLRDYCTEGQRELLDQSQENLPTELVFHDWTETTTSYKTTDGEIISGILQALRATTVVSKSSIRSTDRRILEFVIEEGDTCSFEFDGDKFQGADNECYVLSGDNGLWKLVWAIREKDPEYQKLIR